MQTCEATAALPTLRKGVHCIKTFSPECARGVISTQSGALQHLFFGELFFPSHMCMKQVLLRRFIHYAP